MMTGLTSAIVTHSEVDYSGRWLNIFPLDIKGIDFHLQISLGAFAHEGNILTILKF